MLQHIDFKKSVFSGEGTNYFQTNLRFNVKPGYIYFIGELYLTKKSGFRKYNISFNQDPSILIEACRLKPELFEKYPVTNLDGRVEKRISCK